MTHNNLEMEVWRKEQVPVSVNGNNQDRHVPPTSNNIHGTHSQGVHDNRIIDIVQTKVMGLTIMGKHLYVVQKKPPENIYRYNLDEKNCKLPLTVEGMLYPRGLASSDSKNCIYVIDWHKHYSGRIWCVVMRDDDIQTILDYHLDMQPFGISVSPHRPAGTNMKILITCKNYCKTGKIVVYEQKEDKSLVRSAEDYPLKSAPNPRQSIQNKDGNCFVCFGWWRAESHGLAKISSLDKSASTLKFTRFGKNHDTMNFPYSLALDGNALLVLDHCKNRVLLFNQDLDFKECILTKKHRIKQPRQICIDGQNREMFIGQQDGKIRCFSLSELYTDEL